MYKLNDTQTEVVVEKLGDKNASYDDFIAALPPNAGRYGVFDLEYPEGDGIRQKLVFFVWAPDTAKIKDKMLIASTKDTVKKNFVGISIEIQATEFAETNLADVIAKLKSVSR